MILTEDEPIEASTLANPYDADALCRACNGYMIDYWLPKDNRFWGSFVVAPQSPPLAAAEIRRLGAHPRIVQVLVSHGSSRPYGGPFYHLILEACAEMGLPFAMHLGGQGGLNMNAISGGPTTLFWETHAILQMPAMTHLASLIAHGVFQKWPSLKVIIECGVAWVPSIPWRPDADYKALGRKTPWLKRLPSEYFKSSTRTTDRAEFVWDREGEILRCAWHGWEFDIRTGQHFVGPKVRARRFPVSVEAENLFIQV